MVYVGKNIYPLGRMKMSHMVADSLDELHLMADAIGVHRRHFQDKKGKPHYDICQQKKELAISKGATLVSDRQIVVVLKKTMLMNDLKIEYIDPKKVKFDPRNSRTHSAEQIQQIADSIREFGFTTPIGLDGDGILIFGEGRTKAARVLKLKRIPFVRLTHLSERQRRAYAIADNRLPQNAGWDVGKLAFEFQYLLEDDFDVSKVGFASSEIDAILRNELFDLPENRPPKDEVLVRPYFREKSETEKPIEKKEALSVMVSFKNENERDEFLREMKRRKMKAIILK